MSEEVTEQQKRLDALVRMSRANTRHLSRKAHENAINKLPNELRDRERNWNPYNIYDGGSYAGLYAEENN